MKVLVPLLSTFVILSGSIAVAQETAETAAIIKGTNAAISVFVKCQTGATSKEAKTGDGPAYREATTKCDTKFDDQAVKVVDKYGPVANDLLLPAKKVIDKTVAKTIAIRDAKSGYVDNGDDTVTDITTGLQWEKKQGPSDATPNIASPRDVDNVYTWGAVVAPFEMNGTVLTDYLRRLNGEGGIRCFAGYCDWRLPTVEELTTLPAVIPALGGVSAAPYWSATTDTMFADTARLVNISSGDASATAAKSANQPAIAVRTASSSAAPISCGDLNKCVFMTTRVTLGNIGGLTGADAFCNDSATTAKLPGNYVAWMSDSATAASTRVTSTGPYATRDGIVVANSLIDLTDGTLANPIDRDEYGTYVPLRETYTGTGASGLGSGDYCNDWTFDGGTFDYLATVGVGGYTNFEWTDIYLQFCNRNISIYCLQQ